MSEHRWIRITAVDNVPLREGRAVSIGTREIAVFNLGDRVLATANRCPHRAGPLSDGIVTGAAVVCPLHAWKIDLESGEVQRPGDSGRCIETYPARVENGIIVVRVPGETSDAAKYVCHSVDSDRNVVSGYLVADLPDVYRRSDDDQRR